MKHVRIQSNIQSDILLVYLVLSSVIFCQDNTGQQKVADEKIATDDLIPTIYVDSELNLEELNDRMIKFLNAMEPYGPENMRPVFVSNNLSIDGIPKLLGRDQNTLKFFVKQNKTLIESIGFNMAEHYEKLIQNSPIDIAYVIGENDWNGRKYIQLELKDIKLSENYA